jgi:hypothetical protein
MELVWYGGFSVTGIDRLYTDRLFDVADVGINKDNLVVPGDDFSDLGDQLVQNDGINPVSQVIKAIFFPVEGWAIELFAQRIDDAKGHAVVAAVDIAKAHNKRLEQKRCLHNYTNKETRLPFSLSPCTLEQASDFNEPY